MYHRQQTLMNAVLAAVLAVAGAACSGDSALPTAPSGALTPGITGTGASGPAGDNRGSVAPDGSTLKVTAPGDLAPANVRIDTLRPTLSFTPSSGRFAHPGGDSLTYEIELYREDSLVGVIHRAETSYTVEGDLDVDVLYRWRVRARLGDGAGPWAARVDFATPQRGQSTPPVAPGGGGGAPYGPERHIGIDEAFQLLIAYHKASGVDLGSRSSRESRITWFFSAVAIIHYGHPQFNPSGGDRGWCVKDAGGGRPPSDDVIVRCDTRDFWDTITSAGANGYGFALTYDGRLPGNQNVYPPILGSLPR